MIVSGPPEEALAGLTELRVEEPPMGFLISSLILAVAILIVAKLIEGIHVESFLTAFLAALALGFIQGAVMLITCGLSEVLKILTLGIAAFFINAFGLFLVSQLFQGFQIERGALLKAAVAVTLVNFGLQIILR